MASMSQYQCDKCGKEFPSLAELDYHKISKHTGQLNEQVITLDVYDEISPYYDFKLNGGTHNRRM